MGRLFCAFRAWAFSMRLRRSWSPSLLNERVLAPGPEKADTLSMSRLFSWDTKDAAFVCLCYVESVTSAQIRYAVRRVRRRTPEALILVALFGSNNMQIESEGLGGDIQF